MSEIGEAFEDAEQVLVPAATLDLDVAGTLIEGVRFAADSALEGTGFEPSVPREAPGILVVSVLVPADFSARWNQAEAT
jgi:hypothetical protein